MSKTNPLQLPAPAEPDRACLSRLVQKAMAALLLEEERITLEQVRLLDQEAGHER